MSVGAALVLAIGLYFCVSRICDTLDHLFAPAKERPQ